MVWKRVGALLRDGGSRTVARAVLAVLSSPRGQDVIAAAVDAAQRGKRAFDDAQTQVLLALGYAGKPEYHELLKRTARLKRKARELAEKLDAL